MITTRNISVNLDKGKLKLRHVTTKNIDAGVRVEPPKEPVKTKSITTTTLADVADIAEKKRRDDIAEEQKLAVKDEKKIVQGGYVKEPDKVIENLKIKCVSGIIKTDEEFAREAGAKFVSTNIPIEYKIEKEKKPWKEMTADEKKLAIKERTAKMLVTKARRKKEKEGKK